MLQDTYNYIVSSIHALANDLASGDPMAKGLIIVAIIGAIVALGKNIPAMLRNFIIRKFTVSVKIENVWTGRNKELYNIAGEFVAKHQSKKAYIASAWSNDDRYTKDKIAIIPDYGRGFFMADGIPFYYENEKAEEKGEVPSSITIITLGRDPKVIWDRLDAIEKLNRYKTGRSYYTSSKDSWEVVSDIGNPPKLFLPKAVKTELDKKIDFYMNNKEWYEEHGIAHKLLIILYGEPGTGKSAISRYVADRLDASLGSISDRSSFTERMRNAAMKNMVVSVPDFDTLNLASTRDDEESANKDALLSEIQGANLNEILNLFQGDIPVNDLVVVMSTNCIDKIDPALLRRGRTDLLLEIGPLSYDEVNEFYKHHYESTEDLSSDFINIRIKACDLQGAFEDNPFDKEGFNKDISKHLM